MQIDKLKRYEKLDFLGEGQVSEKLHIFDFFLRKPQQHEQQNLRPFLMNFVTLLLLKVRYGLQSKRQRNGRNCCGQKSNHSL